MADGTHGGIRIACLIHYTTNTRSSDTSPGVYRNTNRLEWLQASVVSAGAWPDSVDIDTVGMAFHIPLAHGDNGDIESIFDSSVESI